MPEETDCATIRKHGSLTGINIQNGDDIKQETLAQAVERAKEYISGVMADGMDLGKGNGPLNHAYKLF